METMGIWELQIMDRTILACNTARTHIRLHTTKLKGKFNRKWQGLKSVIQDTREQFLKAKGVAAVQYFELRRLKFIDLSLSISI